jgi:hypothetical protein
MYEVKFYFQVQREGVSGERQGKKLQGTRQVPMDERTDRQTDSEMANNNATANLHREEDVS